MRKSWQNISTKYTEPAIEAVRVAVIALRRRGIKSEPALFDLASDLGLTGRRVRALFYRDPTPVVLADEWQQIRIRVATVLHREAAELRRHAAELESQAEILETQFSLFGTETGWEKPNGCGSKQRCAA